MNIKVCGITSLQQLIDLDKLMVDYAGLVFDQHSYQCVVGKINPMDITRADLDIKLVGVFADAHMDTVRENIDLYQLRMVQLNGSESPDYCSELSEDIEVIKTFYINDFDEEKIHEMIMDYDGCCDYYSFDNNNSSIRGGVTQAFDWKMIGDTSIEKPFFIGGGGIKPSDASTLHRFKHPDFFGVDINNNFEKEPGVKDTALVLSFMRAVNQVDN